MFSTGNPQEQSSKVHEDQNPSTAGEKEMTVDDLYGEGKAYPEPYVAGRYYSYYGMNVVDIKFYQVVCPDRHWRNAINVVLLVRILFTALDFDRVLLVLYLTTS